jgi:hypothetical protein
MAPRPRLEYADAVYHVMDRGDCGEDMLLDPEDRRCYPRTFCCDLGKGLRCALSL